MVQKIVMCVSVFAVMAVASHANAAFDALCAPEFHNQTFAERPELSSALCETGVPSGTNEGDGSVDNPWKWHCFDDEGNQGQQCVAFQGQVSTCGNGIIEEAEQCDGHEGCSDQCTMEAQCNSSVDGQGVASLPESSTLCSVGTASNVIQGAGTESDPWTWECFDVAGTADASCSAYEQSEEVVDTEVVAEVALPVESTLAGDTAPIVSTTEAVEENALVAPEAAPAATCAVDDYSDIEGEIWHDDNRDGSTSGEDGIEDVTVELYDADGNEIAETETDDDGEFDFENIAPGRYTVDVKQSDSDLDGFHIVYEEDNNRNGRDQLTLRCDDDYDDANFGYDTGARDSAGDRPSTLSQTGGFLLSMLFGFLR